MSSPLSKKMWKPEFRHRCEFPAPPVEEIEARLQAVLTPIGVNLRLVPIDIVAHTGVVDDVCGRL